MVFSLLVLIVISSLFLFMNPLYYSIILLVFSSITCFYLVSSSLVLPLTGLMIMIVYAGAMMILIGYVCAISPNIYIDSISSSKIATIILFSSTFSLVSYSFYELAPIGSDSSVSSLVDFFYNPEGCHMLAFLVIMLFLTILIVTTHHFSPKGPFRSVS